MNATTTTAPAATLADRVIEHLAALRSEVIASGGVDDDATSMAKTIATAIDARPDSVRRVLAQLVKAGRVLAFDVAHIPATLYGLPGAPAEVATSEDLAAHNAAVLAERDADDAAAAAYEANRAMAPGGEGALASGGSTKRRAKRTRAADIDPVGVAIDIARDGLDSEDNDARAKAHHAMAFLRESTDPNAVAFVAERATIVARQIDAAEGNDSAAEDALLWLSNAADEEARSYRAHRVMRAAPAKKQVRVAPIQYAAPSRGAAVGMFGAFDHLGTLLGAWATEQEALDAPKGKAARAPKAPRPRPAKQATDGSLSVRVQNYKGKVAFVAVNLPGGVDAFPKGTTFLVSVERQEGGGVRIDLAPVAAEVA